MPYTASDGSFSLDFPNTPVESSDTDAAGVTTHLLSVDQVYTRFKLAYVDAPPGLVDDLDLEILLDQMVTAITPATATVSNVEDISLDGHPGREVMAKGGPDIVVGRVYVAGDRFYYLQTLTYTDNYSDEAAGVQVFLESFQLTST